MTQLADFARLAAGRHETGTDYADLWQWSVTDPAAFWRCLWDFYRLDEVADGTPEPVLEHVRMPGSSWFPNIRLNYVDAVLAHADLPGAAIVGIDEDGHRSEIGWSELADQVAAVAATLAAAGVGAGDVVAAYLPDIPEAVVAFLAAASLGAIWSGCGQDYAPDGAAGRLAQLEPTVLISCAGYRYGGKWVAKHDDSMALAALLPTLTAHLIVGDSNAVAVEDDSTPGPMPWAHALAAEHGGLSPLRVAFDHPLWVLFSSGTTGKPKGIVHGHGGVVVEHLKAAGLHADLNPGDVFFWHTALSWMMWNFQVAGLLCGARIVCYSGSPLYPDADRLWQVVERERVTYFGTSPGQLQASRKAGLRPGGDHDLSALRTLGSTGSALAADLFEWVDDNVVAGLPVSSISGGTDVVSAFAGGCVGQPVVPGELSVRYLGVALQSWTPQAESVVEEVGEMVITAPMPSMPVSFWADPDGKRYRAAYFEHDWDVPLAEPVWRHGDWVTVTERGSLIIHGRSDATLNRHGIRMGSADIYEVVEGIEEVAEAFVVGVDGPNTSTADYWMPMFVTLRPGESLDDELRGRIVAEIRRRLSPRHVPDEIIEAPGIPHTRTGKKLEVPITAILAGRRGVDVDPQAIDQPELISWYAQQGSEHRW